MYETKICTKCGGKPKPLSEFTLINKYYTRLCTDCYLERRRNIAAIKRRTEGIPVQKKFSNKAEKKENTKRNHYIKLRRKNGTLIKKYTPINRKETIRKNSAKHRNNLSDEYIKKRINKCNKKKYKDISQIEIDIKRLQIQLKREIKNEKSKINESCRR